MKIWDEFSKEFQSTAGRYDMLATFVKIVGPEKIASYSDDEIRNIWNNNVMATPNAFQFNGGSFTGLASRGPAAPIDMEAFHRQVTPTLPIADRRFEITDSGIAMLRWIIHRLAKPLSENDRSKLQEDLAKLIQAVDASNELNDAQKKDLRGYLNAADSVFDMDRPDRSMIRDLIQAAIRLAQRIGADYIAGKIIEFLDMLMNCI